MTIIITTQAFLLVHFTAVSTQYMPQSYPYGYQHASMAMPNQQPMAMPQMNMNPMPLQMPFQMPQRLPMVVMPHHSKSSDKKTRKKHKRVRIASSSDESSSRDVQFRARNKVKRRGKKKHQVLTPVISYVTKEGYVVYQKKIKKEKAKDWLELGKNKNKKEERGLTLEE